MGASPSHQENDDEKDRVISIANSFTTDSNPRDLIISPPLYQSLTLLAASIGDIEVNKLLNRKGFCIYIRGKPTTTAITSTQATSSISTLEVLGYAIVNEITISDDLINNWKQGIDIISTSIQNPIILAISEFVILPHHREKGFARKFINLIKQKYTTSSNGVIGLWPVAPRENELEFARTVILEDEGGAFIAWFYLTQCSRKTGVEEKEEDEEEEGRREEAKDEDDDDEEEDVIREKQDLELYISYQDFKNCKDLQTVKSQIGKIAKEKDLNIQILCHKYADFLSSKFTGSISTDKEEEEEGGGGGGLGFQREYAEAVALLTINDLFREDDDEKDKGKEEIETRNRSTHELENSNLTTTTTTTTTISAAIGSKRSLEITEISSSLSEQMTSSNKRVKENKEEDVEENLG
jgi:hypothetical protein